MNSPKTPLEMFYRWESEVPEQVFLRQSLGNDGWLEFTWAEVASRVRRLATFLRQQGLPAGSNIGIWSSNSADWPVVDLAIQLSGHVSVPLYPGQDIDSARYILDHAEVKLLFLGAFDKQLNAAEAYTGIPTIAIRGAQAGCDHRLEQIISNAQPFADSPVPDADSLFTIVYTSGTTGRPKGVMLAHGTPAAGTALWNKWLDMASSDFTGERGRLFSFLPMSHLGERIVVEMSGIYRNATISFSAGLDTFAEELRSVQPTLFFSVPRLWAKFKAGVDAKISPQAQAGLDESGRENIRHQLGLAKARCVLTGSSTLSQDVQQWYQDMGINLRAAYGMSETCGIGTFTQTDDAPVLGAVGTPVAGAELKISEDGEICLKTGALMIGYYKNPEKTAEVIVDGWYQTGDRGYVGEDGLLRVTGRMGEVFKTTKGKFVHPNGIESRFSCIDELGQLMIFGHARDQPLLLASLSELGQSKTREEVNETLKERLADINKELLPYERVAQIFVTSQEWTTDVGLVTSTMKIKRKEVENYYRERVERNKGSSPVNWIGE